MKYHVSLKTTMLAVALSAVTFNASADWMIKNGFCQTVTDNGQMLLMLKVTNISVVGQLPCQSKYYMRGETVAINGYPYPALGICDASTSWKPISIVDTRQVDATKIFAAVAAKEQTIVAAQGGSDVIRRSDYLQVCPSVLPSLTNMNVPAQRSALSMDVILAAAKHAYATHIGDADEAGSADWGSVKQLPDSKYKGQVVRVIKYEVYNVPYKSYDDVTVFVADDGRVINTEVKSR